MAITTYSELQTAVSDFLNRDDLSSVVPNFIALAEAAINRDVRNHRMITRATVTLNAQYEALPSDWLQTERLLITTTPPINLALASPDEIAFSRARFADALGQPRYFTHQGSSVELWPTPDGDYTAELVYYAKVAALSGSNTTNWLLTAAPDIYLYGSLIHSAPYLSDDARTTVWAAMYQAAVQSLAAESNKARQSGAVTMRFRRNG